MRPTRFGSARQGQVRLGMGYDPDEPIGEPEEPTDYLRDESATAWYPVWGEGSTSLIQDKTYLPGSSAPVSYPVSFDTAVTAGSLLVVMIVARSDSGSGFAGPVGWTEGNVIDANGFNGGSGVIFHKIADGTEGTGPFTFNRSTGSPQGRVWMAEFGGEANEFVDVAEVDAHAATTALALGDVTPTNGQPALLIAGVLNGATIASISGYTEIDRGFVEGGVNGPYSGLWYKIVDPASGDYGATTTQTSGNECASDHMAFSAQTEPLWIPAPLTIDEDDATYHEVTGHTECWRGQLQDNYQVARARLVIGTETSGSKSYDLEGQTLADIDADTGTVIGTFDWTATGSYTADTIEISTAGSAGYEFYRLVGPDENRRIYTVNLYSPTGGDEISAELDDHLTDPLDAHDASAVSVADSAGWFTGVNVETTLAELAAKAIGYQGHGSLGSTETFDAAIGSHSGTLNANCTFTLTAAASGTASTLVLELAQDGTGGWTIDLPASVVNGADIEADQDTTASETTFLALYSRDGGTTWYGGWWGGGGGTGGGVTVEDEGTPLSTVADTLDFTGAGVTASGTGGTKTINIPGGGSGTGQGLVDFEYAHRTAGNVTTNSTTWANVDTGTDLVLSASTGDVLHVTLSAGAFGTEAVTLNLTAMSIVAGSPVNDFATATTPSNTTNGVSAWRAASGSPANFGGGIMYSVQAGDISGGTVTVRLRYRSASATNRVLTASDPALVFMCSNIGQPL